MSRRLRSPACRSSTRLRLVATDPIQRLIQRLARLPGIGEKTATRLAFHILRAPEGHARELAQSILEVREKIRLCSLCCNLTRLTAAFPALGLGVPTSHVEHARL